MSTCTSFIVGIICPDLLWLCIPLPKTTFICKDNVRPITRSCIHFFGKFESFLLDTICKFELFTICLVLHPLFLHYCPSLSMADPHRSTNGPSSPYSFPVLRFPDDLLN